MFLDKLQLSDLIIFNCIILLVILFLVFKWFFRQVRDICKEPEGIIKFGQISFILLSWGCFLGILIYFVLKPGETSVLHIFLTIVVGFLGTILGLFFSRDAIENLKKTSDVKSDFIKEDTVELLEDVEKLIKENIGQKKEIEKLKRRL
ncbi:MAG: hypothetical protein KKC75_02270 [Nanoarchaeota archaeon]|nr:hypothetical protein [Nanoarchaeota archaeon]MBU1005546.1 hypothetical protein [Nanoarchaeota archaeon]MBU1946605.1 hypothetical protein [Nanoarchaeota archaeon]